MSRLGLNGGYWWSSPWMQIRVDKGSAACSQRQMLPSDKAMHGQWGYGRAVLRSTGLNDTIFLEYRPRYPLPCLLIIPTQAWPPVMATLTMEGSLKIFGRVDEAFYLLATHLPHHVHLLGLPITAAQKHPTSYPSKQNTSAHDTPPPPSHSSPHPAWPSPRGTPSRPPPCRRP